jgi:hypothetical protein
MDRAEPGRLLAGRYRLSGIIGHGERARGGPSGAPGDLWGLGASLYAVAGDQRPAPQGPGRAPRRRRDRAHAPSRPHPARARAYRADARLRRARRSIRPADRASGAGHRDPDNGGIFLLIDQSDKPKPNALADWQQQASAREGSYPDYHQIRLQSVSCAQAQQAADWEFTYNRDGTLVHILNRNILANAHHAYALYWSTPESDWNAYYRYFEAFAATFRPAPA